MNKTIWQQFKPHVIAIGIFLIIAVLFCLPAFQGMILNQHDTLGWRGMIQQSQEYKEKFGHWPLWSTWSYSGIPAFQIGIEASYNITLAVLHIVFTAGLPEPASFFFLSCIGFYILTQTLGLRSITGIFGSLGYAYASYNAIIAAIGHNTKLMSMGYAPALLAGLILLSQRKYVLGFLVTLTFSTLLTWQNHLQILYYTYLIAGCFGVSLLIRAIREKDFKPVILTAALAIASLLLGVANYAVILLPTNSYSKESMRGGRSELTIGPDGKKLGVDHRSKGGLDKDYAFNWSYGIAETMTLTMPAYNGGSDGPRELPENGKAIQALQESQLPQEFANYIYPALNSYWGAQPGTSATVYLGAIICLLFIVGIFVVKSPHKGWIIAASIIGIVLAWGSNFQAVNYFLFDYLPFYNKFRAVTTALVIPQLTFALLATMALNDLLFKDWDKAELMKKIKFAGIGVLVVVAILLGTYFTGSFKAKGDNQLREGIAGAIMQMAAQGGQPNEQVQQQARTISSGIMNGLSADRKTLYEGDLLRTLLFFALAAALVWLGAKKKLKGEYIMAIFIVLNLIDLLPVDRRYLKDENYIAKEDFLAPFNATAADLQIKQDTGYYRVFDQTAGNPFADSRASYHHHSIGGYLPARLATYDDIATYQLNRGNMAVFNMLNTKYFIVADPQTRQPVAQVNPGALGAAWFVKSIQYVPNADAEMTALNSFHPADTAIMDQREKSKVAFEPQFDSLATIKLISNTSDAISYETNAASNQFAVFSEVYYPNGWSATIDGKPAQIAKVNYTLRGMSIPSGKHTIEFKFEPQSYKTGNTITLISGIISILLVLGGCWWLWKKKAQ
ncbi:YfhO family protein [Pseudoflavitalea sp. G-6-1-2]|uniref:YfhO family protein n=1 Tax=Pseudoflavitalea sp. G-6-1-2 TaxID=2728841 RepID=UPI00146A3E1B|nr:YfhO family protein [Pseudoflavitalea sp. G-6-1-2]NML21819.1 YfhO family protein [Pseudoflavitalea sp. G-6-1-2]